MKKSLLNFAGLNIEINHSFSQFQDKSEYFSDKVQADFCVAVSSADIEAEREITKKQCAYEGIVYPDYSDAQLENTAIYRKIADNLIRYNAFVFHGSAVAVDNSAYLFTAPSGTGKTTHSRLWLENIEGSFIVNGDKPIIRLIDGKPFACGTPWAGKENYGKNVCVPLKAICLLGRGERNTIEKISLSDAVSFLIGQTYRPKNTADYIATIKLIEKIGKSVGLYKLYCNMEKEAALISFGGMSID